MKLDKGALVDKVQALRLELVKNESAGLKEELLTVSRNQSIETILRLKIGAISGLIDERVVSQVQIKDLNQMLAVTNEKLIEYGRESNAKLIETNAKLIEGCSSGIASGSDSKVVSKVNCVEVSDAASSSGTSSD